MTYNELISHELLTLLNKKFIVMDLDDNILPPLDEYCKCKNLPDYFDDELPPLIFHSDSITLEADYYDDYNPYGIQFIMDDVNDEDNGFEDDDFDSIWNIPDK